MMNRYMVKMKILIVKKKDSCWPFVEEQVNALQMLDIECAWHLIEGRGVISYMRDMVKLIRKIRFIQPDVIHAHYGISGYYVCMVVRLMGLAKKIPVVITYHGSDINNPKVRKISKYAIRMADYNIFVSHKLMEKVEHGENSQVIPCGLNMKDWPLMDKTAAREKMGLSAEKRYVLFSSDFQTAVKNPKLAKQAVDYVKSKVKNEVELVELKGYSRREVNALMHGVDVCLMTSFTEGSPQFIKEAMACGCPIVTTRVGDTDYVIGDTDGCYFTDYAVENCAMQLEKALRYAEAHDRTKGRERIEALGYSNEIVAQKINDIYLSLLK